MIGHTISHYRILEELGEGGMGGVYLAEDAKGSRQVAIKRLPGSIARTSSADSCFPMSLQFLSVSQETETFKAKLCGKLVSAGQ